MEKIIGIKFSNAGIDATCALCGGYHETAIGLEIFTEDGGLVCDDCAAVYAPELLRARNIISRDEAFLHDVMTENYNFSQAERIPADWKNEFDEVLRIATSRK